MYCTLDITLSYHFIKFLILPVGIWAQQQHLVEIVANWMLSNGDAFILCEVTQEVSQWPHTHFTIFTNLKCTRILLLITQLYIFDFVLFHFSLNWLLTWHLFITCKLFIKYIIDVLDMAWSPDDSFLASGSVDNTITIWNAQRFPGL